MAGVHGRISFVYPFRLPDLGKPDIDQKSYIIKVFLTFDFRGFACSGVWKGAPLLQDPPILAPAFCEDPPYDREAFREEQMYSGKGYF